MRSGLAGAALALCCANIACSHTATITRNNYPLEATILDADDKNIYVTASEGPTTIPKAQVSEIVHPGHGLMLLGTLATAVGVLGFPAVAETQEDGGERALGYTGAVLITLYGLVTLLDGIGTYSASVKALQTPHHPATKAVLVPTLAPTKGGANAGFVVTF